MTLELTDNERTKLGLRGQRICPKTSSDSPGRGFDAIWVGRQEDAAPFIRGWLNVMAFEDRCVLAMILNHGDWEPELRKIPDEEIVWFLRGPNPPGLAGSVPCRDPVMALPGELEAYRLRRILGVHPLEMINPSDMISRQPEFSTQLVLRSPNNQVMYFGFTIIRTRPRFIIEYEANQPLREASAAFSLLRWYFQMHGTGKRQFEWNHLEGLLDSEGLSFMRFFETYQALRLPGLRLALEYRASPLRITAFIHEFAQVHQLPVLLVERRFEALRLRQETLALD